MLFRATDNMGHGQGLSAPQRPEQQNECQHRAFVGRLVLTAHAQREGTASSQSSLAKGACSAQEPSDPMERLPCRRPWGLGQPTAALQRVESVATPGHHYIRTVEGKQAST